MKFIDDAEIDGLKNNSKNTSLIVIQITWHYGCIQETCILIYI